MEEYTFAGECKDETFTIDSDQKAEWAIQKIAEKQTEHDRLVELGEENIRKTEERIEYIKEKFNTDTAFLRSELSKYFDTVPHKKTKTTEKYKLFSGELVLKLGQPAFNKDDDKLLGYLKDNKLTDYIKTEEKPAWGEYKKRLDVMNGVVVDKESGEVVDCITVEMKSDEFVVKIG